MFKKKIISKTKFIAKYFLLTLMKWGVAVLSITAFMFILYYFLSLFFKSINHSCSKEYKESETFLTPFNNVVANVYTF